MFQNCTANLSYISSSDFFLGQISLLHTYIYVEQNICSTKFLIYNMGAVSVIIMFYCQALVESKLKFCSTFGTLDKREWNMIQLIVVHPGLI